MLSTAAYPTARPAMTIENSPRAMSAAPARARPSGPMPTLLAAHQPVATFVSVVATARTKAQPSTGGIDLGSVWSPNTTKNTAANRSRNGSSSFVAFSAGHLAIGRVHHGGDEPPVAQRHHEHDGEHRHRDPDRAQRSCEGHPDQHGGED